MDRRSLAALLLILAACPKGQEQGDAGAPSKHAVAGTFTVVATGDVGSDTEPCGCKVRPMGGVSRRAQVVKELGAQPALVVDAGDHFFRSTVVSPRDEPQARETALFLAQALRRMQARAIAVGERDLALGLPFLRALEKESGAALLSANLLTRSGTAAFAPYVIAERGGVKVGIVGASLEIEPKAPAAELYEKAGLNLAPTLPAVAAAAAAARQAGADFVLALLHTGTRAARELASKLEPGLVDLVVAAHDRETGVALEPVGPTGLVLTGERGKWVALIDVEARKSGRGVRDRGAIEGAQRELQDLEARIRTYRGEDAGAGAVAEKSAADRAALVGRLLRRQAQVQADLAAVPDDGRHLVRLRMEPLDVARAEDEAMHAAEEAYQDRLRVVNAGVAPVPRSELSYVGNTACKKCHEAALIQWSGTGHARAWATLERTRQTANLDCVPCHTTGFDHPGGPRSIPELKPFQGVGCESCHGPGSQHSAEPKAKLEHGRDVPERVCAECHRAQADQKPFDFEERLPRVLGRGHGKK